MDTQLVSCTWLEPWGPSWDPLSHFPQRRHFCHLPRSSSAFPCTAHMGRPRQHIAPHLPSNTPSTRPTPSPAPSPPFIMGTREEGLTADRDKMTASAEVTDPSCLQVNSHPTLSQKGMGNLGCHREPVIQIRCSQADSSLELVQ